MDTDIFRRLQTVGQSLHLRAIAHSPGPDQDTAKIMQGLAISMEAIQDIAADLASLRGDVESLDRRVKNQ